jgi:cytochrome P460
MQKSIRSFGACGTIGKMTKRRISYLFVTLAGLALVIALASGRSHGAKDEFRFDAGSLKDTSSWTKVNAEPYRLAVAVDALCRAPTAEDYAPARKRNPHSASFITVYVNNIGREAMFAKQVQRFPEGSVIVKEKISNYNEGSKPLLYTLMRKREPGYNPEVGDWEFSVVAANGTQVEATGKLENCQFCHKNKRDSDFIFRPYLKSN